MTKLLTNEHYHRHRHRSNWMNIHELETRECLPTLLMMWKCSWQDADNDERLLRDIECRANVELNVIKPRRHRESEKSIKDYVMIMVEHSTHSFSFTRSNFDSTIVICHSRFVHGSTRDAQSMKWIEIFEIFEWVRTENLKEFQLFSMEIPWRFFKSVLNW